MIITVHDTCHYSYPVAWTPIRNSASLWDNWMKWHVSFLPSVCVFMGQKEDLFCLFLGQPRHHEGCIQLHGHGWPAVWDKLIYTGRGNNPCWRHEHLYVYTAMVWWKRPPTHVKWLGANYWISRCMEWVYGSRVEEGRWQKANTLWWACVSAFTVAWFTLISNSSFLQMGTLQRTTRFNRSVTFRCCTTLISSGMLTGRAPAFWMGMILTLPTSFHSPVLSFTFQLGFFQVCAAPSSCTETGCLWLFEKLLWFCFLDDKSGSILGLWGATLGLVGEDNVWPRDASDGNLGRW